MNIMKVKINKLLDFNGGSSESDITMEALPGNRWTFKWSFLTNISDMFCSSLSASKIDISDEATRLIYQKFYFDFSQEKKRG